MKITNNFHYKWKSLHADHKITVRIDKWDTKEGTGKSMENALHSCMANGTSQAEATSNNEKIKPVALAIVELH